MGFDYKTSTELWETETQLLEGIDKILCAPRPGGKDSDPTGDGTRPASYCWRVSCGLVLAHCRDRGTGSSSPERRPLEVRLKATANPTIEPADPRDGLPQAKQLTERECTTTHQLIIVLKLNPARPCPPRARSHFPHQVPPIRKLTQAS